MKLQFILLSYILVNVLGTYEVEYKKKVFITNLHIGQAFTQNELGLRRVIKNIVTGNTAMEQVAMMLTVPELADMYHLRRCINIQNNLQEEVYQVTSIPVPQVDPNRDFSEYSLADIGAARRIVIKIVAKAIILNAINGDDPNFYGSDALCRLMGLYRNIKFPNTYVITAQSDRFGVCVLTDFENSISYYRFLRNKVWEVEFVGYEATHKLLSEEISRW